MQKSPLTRSAASQNSQLPADEKNGSRVVLAVLVPAIIFTLIIVTVFLFYKR
jgi:hypothetical protein